MKIGTVILTLPDDFTLFLYGIAIQNESSAQDDLQENGIKEGSPRFSLDLLRQYSDAFYSYIN